MYIKNRSLTPVRGLISRIIPRFIKDIILRTTKINQRRDKKVVLMGWFGAFNLGDEMMLDVTLQEMNARGIGTTVLTHKDGVEVERRYKGRTNFVRRRPLENSTIENIVRDNDSLFINGGALIDDYKYEDVDSLARDISRVSQRFIEEGKGVVVYGVSTNKQLNNSKYKRDLRNIIDGARFFSVRDTYSKDLLHSISGSRNIKVVDDIVFADRLLRDKPHEHYNGSRIAVTAVMNDETIGDLSKFFDKLIRVTDSPIRLILFFDENNNDARYTEYLKQYLGDRRFCIEEVINPKDSRELRNALFDVDVYISMRYHGVLFASAVGKKVVSLEYDTHSHYSNKNEYMRKHYGYGVSSIALSQIDSITDDKLRELIRSAKPADCDIGKVNSRARNDLLSAIKML